MAMEIARRKPQLEIDTQFAYEAAMLHDIGIFRTHAPEIFCRTHSCANATPAQAYRHSTYANSNFPCRRAICSPSPSKKNLCATPTSSIQSRTPTAQPLTSKRTTNCKNMAVPLWLGLKLCTSYSADAQPYTRQCICATEPSSSSCDTSPWVINFSSSGCLPGPYGGCTYGTPSHSFNPSDS